MFTEDELPPPPPPPEQIPIPDPFTLSVSKLREVWEFAKIKMPLDEFMNLYDNYETVYKHKRMQNMSYEEVFDFRFVFYFKGKDIQACARQLTYWMSIHKEFYHDDHYQMIRMIGLRVLELNQQRVGFPIRYINLFPEYGGKVQDARKAIKYEMKLYEDAQMEYPFQPPIGDDDWSHCQIDGPPILKGILLSKGRKMGGPKKYHANLSFSEQDTLDF